MSEAGHESGERPEGQAVTVEPDDEHNRALVSHVHPSHRSNPVPRNRYNLVVVGAGTAGLVTAAGAAGLGARVALVERHLMGGDCLNVGCVPSKALLRSARAAADARRAGEFGVELPGDGEVRVDFPAVMERMRRLRAQIAPNDSAARFGDLGVDVFLGEAAFTGPDTLAVEGQTLEFARACVATGSRPVAPPVPGLAEAGYLTNETVFTLTERPRRLAVIGAGPIGCELAQAFARFGSEVTLIEAGDRILPRDDAEAGEIVRASMEADGVSIICGGKAARVDRDADGAKRVHLECEGEPRELAVEEILVAAGRRPNTDRLNLDAASVEHGEAGVWVDNHLRTTNRRVYAAGDVCSRYRFTHVADALARIVIRNALFGFLPPRASVASLVVPWCTYTDPELAHTGRSPEELERQGVPYETQRLDLRSTDRALLDGEREGLLKVHVGRKGRVLGGTLVARHAGEMISELTLGINRGVSMDGYSSTIHPYPTQAQVFRKAGDNFVRGRLTPGVRKLMQKLLDWQR